MAKVCCEKYPIGSIKGQRSAGFYMDGHLKENLDILIKNIGRDWDFTIVVSGGGKVRVGKSYIAAQVAAYILDQVNKLYGKNYELDLNKNFVFTGAEMVQKGNALSNEKFNVLIYDEAGGDLQGKKVMTATTKLVMDYFRECGQYNLFNILVLPDFFDLPKGLAITRSICLIDVTYNTDDKGIFQRGLFRFFNQNKKKELYINGKKTMDYMAVYPNFKGQFLNFYPINAREYRKLKDRVLKARAKLSKKEIRQKAHLKAAVKYMREQGMTLHEIADYMSKKSGESMSHMTVENILDKKASEVQGD